MNPIRALEIVSRVGGTLPCRATYEPGWKWSEHVGASSRAGHAFRRHDRPSGEDQGRERPSADRC